MKSDRKDKESPRLGPGNCNKNKQVIIQNKLNPYQLKLYQRLIRILPNVKEKNLIEEFLVMHILGISQDKRIVEAMKNLGLLVGETIEDKGA